MNNLVLDTDIFIDFLRGSEKASSYFEELKNSNIIVHFSAVTEIELISGKECNKIERKAELLRILSHFVKVPVDNQIAVKAGDFRRAYGTPFTDAAIAATAFAMKADLVTRNVGDYKGVKEVKIKVPY